MSSTSNTAADEDVTVPTTAVTRRRRRTAFRVLLPILAVVTVGFATTACTPEATARDAIETYWGSNSACAMRIVDRESNFQAGVVNRSSGTIGLFQIHPTHANWIWAKYGYAFSELKDPYKNARVAKGLSTAAYNYYGDGWQPWRIDGSVRSGGGCPA